MQIQINILSSLNMRNSRPLITVLFDADDHVFTHVCSPMCVRQLVDLRDVIARMLGLSLDALAVPDYELILRLEQLILANQSNVSTAMALESAMHAKELGEGFRAGYSRAGWQMAAKPRTGGGNDSSSVLVGLPAGVTSSVHRRDVEAGLS